MSISGDEDGLDTVPSGRPRSEGTVFLGLPPSMPREAEMHFIYLTY